MISHFDLQENRLKQDIQALAEMVDRKKPGYTRRPFTQWQTKSRDWLIREMEACGLTVRIDAASNLIGRLEGTNPDLPPIMVGSHTDSVVGGGRFDGIIGVLGGLEIARQLKEKGIKLKHTLEVVDFTGEEASEFGISTIGSRGMVGNLRRMDFARLNDEGIRLDEAIRSIGGRPEAIADEARRKDEVTLYLELHIEQGPILEQRGIELGVVTGIVGIERFRVMVHGEANHAGTTPMNLRVDALTAASELVLALESMAFENDEEAVVATVGRQFVEPNGANIVPGKVRFELEIRSLDQAALDQMIKKFGEAIERVEKKRDVKVEWEQLSHADPIIVPETILQGVEESCRLVGSTLKLPSGAGHDANQLSSIAPVGMIFIPSIGGKSHCPEEETDYHDVAKGVQALGHAVLYFDNFFHSGH